MELKFELGKWFIILFFFLASCSPLPGGENGEPDYVKGGGGTSFPIIDSVGSAGNRQSNSEEDGELNQNNSEEDEGLSQRETNEGGASSESDSGEIEDTSSSQEPVLAFSQLPSILLENKEAYPVSGTCDSSQNFVSITIGSSEEELNLDCQSDNSFSGVLDASFEESDPVTVTVVQEDGRSEGVAVSIENQTQHFMTLWEFVEDQYTLTIPLSDTEGITYNFFVDWGDGSPLSKVSSFDDKNRSHTYDKAGNYKVRIKGLCEGFEDPRGDPSRPHSDALVDIINEGCSF